MRSAIGRHHGYRGLAAESRSGTLLKMRAARLGEMIEIAVRLDSSALRGLFA